MLNELNDMQRRELDKHIAIATTTSYRLDPKSGFYKSDVIRADLAAETIKCAAGIGYEIFVVDGGSPSFLTEEFTCSGAHVYRGCGESMGADRRRAMREAAASGRPYIAWMEPEKAPLVHDLWKSAVPLLGGADIVVPKRFSLNSYPAVQKESETRNNKEFEDLTGCDLDLWFGPRAMGFAGLMSFINYDGTHHGKFYGDKWDSVFVPPVLALINGKNVVSVPVNYVHPSEQREIEECNPVFDEKRRAQTENVMPALREVWKNRGWNGGLVPLTRIAEYCEIPCVEYKIYVRGQ